jgi:hypothetical protein
MTWRGWLATAAVGAVGEAGEEVGGEEDFGRRSEGPAGEALEAVAVGAGLDVGVFGGEVDDVVGVILGGSEVSWVEREGWLVWAMVARTSCMVWPWSVTTWR